MISDRTNNNWDEYLQNSYDDMLYDSDSEYEN